MLARTAEGLYWMSRYLERTQHLCRLLGLQAEALVDRPVSEIHFGWSRIYASLGRQPPAGGIVLLENDNYLLADSYTLADDLTFERSNLDSVWSCFAQGRENARQMRQVISAEMWSRLNLAYLRLREMAMPDIWRNSPETFYSWMTSEIDTLVGIMGTTMYRDEGWQFIQLGHYIERAQLLSSLLVTQIDLGEAVEEYSDADWKSLLQIYHSVEAHNRRYTIEVKPDNVIDILATDALLPRSLIRSLDMSAREIGAIGAGYNLEASDSTSRLAGRLTSILHQEWPDHTGKRELLARVNTYCRDLHQLVSDTYFNYSHIKGVEVSAGLPSARS